MTDRPVLEVVTAAGVPWGRGRGRHTNLARSSDGIWQFERHDRVASAWFVRFQPWRLWCRTLPTLKRGVTHEQLVAELLDCVAHRPPVSDAEEALAARPLAEVEAEVWDLIEQANRTTEEQG